MAKYKVFVDGNVGTTGMQIEERLKARSDIELLTIPEKDRNDVFKAFFRLDASRNSQTGGVGLGLTITRDIVLAHGGEISLAQSPFGGLRVILKFPL